jgi:hypothetical protein
LQRNGDEERHDRDPERRCLTLKPRGGTKKRRERTHDKRESEGSTRPVRGPDAHEQLAPIAHHQDNAGTQKTYTYQRWPE